MPTVYIHDYRLLSSLGTSPDDTLSLLASESPTPPHSTNESLYRAARERLLRQLPDHDVTHGLVVAATLVFPLIDRLATVPHNKTDLTALIVGNSTSGLQDVIRDLRSPEQASSPAVWSNLELGRPASLLARASSDTYTRLGPAYVISTACTAGAKALAEGARLLLSGLVTRVIAGGTDILNAFTETGFASLGAVSPTSCRPFCADRDGLRLGEGGAFFLLSLEPTLNGVPARWTLSGWGETSDAHHISAPIATGAEAGRAIDRALAMAGKTPDAVDFILLHGTGTPQNDSAEAAALTARLPNTPAASFKRLTGHQLAGAGAFGAALACALTEHPDTDLPLNFTATSTSRDPGLAPMTLTGPEPMHRPVKTVLVNAFAFGGSNVALLIERLEKDTAKPLPSLDAYDAMLPEDRAALFTAEALLPQRPPMLLIDRPLALFDDGALSETVIRADSLLSENGVFAAEGLIEIMAQTVGLYAGARSLVAGRPIEPGLLLGTRRLTLPTEGIPVGTRLITKTLQSFFDNDSLWQFTCEVRRAEATEDTPLATATLTLFAPPPGYWDQFDQELSS